MIIRQTLNFAAHLAAGVAFGVLAVVALGACAQKRIKAPAPIEPLPAADPADG